MLEAPAQDELDRLLGGRPAAERSVADERRAPARWSRPGRRSPRAPGPTGPVEPGAEPEQRPLQPDLDPGVVGRLHPVEQVGPAGLVARRVRVGAIDQAACDVGRRDRPRAVRPGDPRPEPDHQPPAQVGGLDRRGELPRHLPLPRLLAVGRQDRPVEQPAHPASAGVRSQGPSGDGTSFTATSSVGIGRERLAVAARRPRRASGQIRRASTTASSRAGAVARLGPLLDSLAGRAMNRSRMSRTTGCSGAISSRSWRNLRPLAILAQLDRAGDPAGVGRGELIEQSRDSRASAPAARGAAGALARCPRSAAPRSPRRRAGR